nr:extensin-like [Quercus suber]
MNTLKRFKTDLKKAKEELKEMTKARDNMEGRESLLPPAIREVASANSEVGTTSKATDEGQAGAAKDPTSIDKPSEETRHQGALEKEETSNQEAPQDVVKPPAESQATPADSQATHADSPAPPVKKELPETTLPSQDPKASDAASRQIPKDKLSIKLKK